MINPRKKSKYWVDDNSILPEIIITPQGNFPILDEAGNPARTVGAIQDINPNAHIYERVNTQPFMDDYIEGETNTAANQRADALDATVVPHIGDFVSTAAKPLDALMPSRWVGLLDKDYNGLSAVDRFSRLFDENNRGLFINDNPYGLFSKQYAEEHPYWAMAGNTAFDIVSTPFIINGAKEAYNVGKTVAKNVPNAMQFLNSPYTGKWTRFGNKEYRFKPGYMGMNGVPIESRIPRITEENAAAMTPEQWTAAQDYAIERGDMIEAQRLRDLHFKVSAPNTQIIDKNGNPIHSYHGTGKRFYEFDTTGKYSTLDEGYYGRGAYFTPNKELAQIYADTEKTPVIYDTYLNIKNPLRHIRDENADLYGKIITNNDGVISTLPEDLVDETFDMTEYVATNPNQIKLADAVTYNENGVRIPLGDRDNFSNPDIRYGFIPWLLGAGTAGTAYGISNQNNLQIQVQKFGGRILPPWHK